MASNVTTCTKGGGWYYNGKSQRSTSKWPWPMRLQPFDGTFRISQAGWVLHSEQILKAD